MKLLIGVTGSVAAMKLPLLLQQLVSKYEKIEIKVVLTSTSCHFIDLKGTPDNIIFYQDQDEWTSWKQLRDPILHIELRKWADIFLIAPLSANSLAKIANGLCDNLVTCIVRAWDPRDPLLLAPAMNTLMWNNAVTKKHLDLISEYYANFTVIPPMTKILACGDEGMGAMASVEAILEIIDDQFDRTFKGSLASGDSV